MWYRKNKFFRTVFIVLFLSISSYSFSQLKAGFDPVEAKSLMAICNSYTFLNLYGTDTLIVPKDYQKVYTSEVIGLDNMFQVYENGNIGVINFRGSTSKASSWIENVYSAMIPAEGVIKVDNKNYNYKFALDTAAGVHSGYALATVLLSPILIEQINNLNNNGIYHILITGHSQGGALATLSRAYFENLSEGEISSKNVFKTYSFGNPMCGNEEFTKEYDAKYSKLDMSYTIINPSDLVPKTPMHFQEKEKLLDELSLKNWANGTVSVDTRFIKEYTLQLFEPLLERYVNVSNQWIEKLISTSFVSIEMPEYMDDINYFQTGSVRELAPFPYPKILMDTLAMNQKEISKLKMDGDGNYYKEEPTFFQHKPYNYYVGILKEYFSKDYEELDLLYLPENVE